MARIIIGSVCLIVFVGSVPGAFTQEKDPFRSKLPSSAREPVTPAGVSASTGGYGDLLAEIGKISLEGIVWSEKFSAAIINGQVYSKGDTIKEIDATITDIGQGKLTIEYKGKTYVLLKGNQ